MNFKRIEAYQLCMDNDSMGHRQFFPQLSKDEERVLKGMREIYRMPYLKSSDPIGDLLNAFQAEFESHYARKFGPRIDLD